MDELSKPAEQLQVPATAQETPIPAQTPAPADNSQQQQVSETTTTTTVAQVNSAEQQDEDEDEDEWDKAMENAFPGLKDAHSKNKEQDKNEPTEQPQAPQTTQTTTVATAQTPADGGPEKPKDAADEAAAAPPKTPEQIARDTRLAQKEAEANAEAIRNDVSSALYREAPTELRDSEGDPIRSIEDVQKLVNPATGELFTENEAGSWFLRATQELNQSIAARNKEIDQIADVNVNLQEEAAIVKQEFGDYLSKNPKLRESLWADYTRTLKTKRGKNDKGEDIDVIVDTPLSIETFYRNALEPRIEFERQAAAVSQPTQQPQGQQQPVTPQQPTNDEQKRRELAERSDIYTPSNEPEMSDDEKEWAEAHKKAFGDRLK